MTDLEMTKLCAEAMGYYLMRPSASDHAWHTAEQDYYDPLHNDAQAMALVKMLRPANLSYNIFAGRWSVHTLRDNETGARFESFDADLNRAIVECVAKMQAAKAVQP